MGDRKRELETKRFSVGPLWTFEICHWKPAGSPKPAVSSHSRAWSIASCAISGL